MGLAVFSLAVFATGVVAAFAQSPPATPNNQNDFPPPPQPGYTYWVIYSQTDGSIISAVGCPPGQAYCVATPKQGQSAVYITDQPSLVKQLFADGHDGKLGNWHMNLQTHQLESTATTSTGPIAPLVSEISTMGAVFPGMGLFGLAISSTLLWRKKHIQHT